MKIKIIILLLTLSFSLFSETIMVETIESGDYGTLPQPVQNRLTQVKTGVMDVLFDGGHIFFDMYTDQLKTTEQGNMQTLQLARRSGATWFLRITTGEDFVAYEIHDLKTFTLKEEGTLLKSDIDKNARLSKDEFFFEAGKALGNSTVIIIGS